MHTTKLFWKLNVAEFSIKPEDGPPKCIGFKDTENGNEADKSIQYSCPAERKKERKKERREKGRKKNIQIKEGGHHKLLQASLLHREEEAEAEEEEKEEEVLF